MPHPAASKPNGSSGTNLLQRPDHAGWLWRMPIGRKLSALVATGCLVVAVLLLVVWVSMQATDAMRAYVGGEGLWSKAQKSAVYHLTRYAYSGEVADWSSFQAQLQITLDVREARLAMEAPELDYAYVEAAFVRAGMARADVPNLVRGFRLFGDISHMARATRLWREADGRIDQLLELALELAGAQADGPLSDNQRDRYLQGIAKLNAELSVLEDDFSTTLGVGARWASHTALLVILGSASLLLCLGLILSSRLTREIRTGIAGLCEGAERVAAGDLGFRITPASGDELGDLALSFNDMIARRARAERTLQNERQLLQTMLDNLSEAVVACDADGRLSLFNRAARLLHGLGTDSNVPAQWVGQHGDLFEPNGTTPLTASEDPLLCALRGQRTAGRQIVIAPYDGASHTVLATGQRLQSPEGGALGAVVTLHDITTQVAAEKILARRARELEQANGELANSNRELRRLYQAEAASEAKSRFVATISHEIRTPLHGIVGLLEVFAMDNLSPQQRRNLDLMRESGEVLQHLIDDVLDFAKIEAGRMDLELVALAPRSLAESVCVALTHGAQTRGIALSLQCDPAVPAQIEGDPGRLRQILLNLLSNALKFTPRGGSVKLDIGLDEAEQAGTRLTFSVTDTGVGLPPESLERVFESFVQAESSTTRRYGGTGLGLAICKGLVDQMGGEIACTSREGEGSRFWKRTVRPLRLIRRAR